MGNCIALIFADGAAEHFALFGIGARAVDEEAAVADAFRRDQDALGIHAVDDVAEALALFADQIFGRHFQIVEEQFGRGVIDHRADRADGEALADRLAFISTSSTLMPSVGLAASSRGVVRTSSTIRSECSARLIQIFWPLTMYLSPSRFAKVGMRVVSVPLVGSVTPKACRRNSPLAIFGR